MRVSVTLVRGDGSRDDIVVMADAGTTIGEVASAINQVDPRGAHRDVSLTLKAQLPDQQSPVVLPPEALLGQAWVGSGAVVALTAAAEASCTGAATGTAGPVAFNRSPRVEERFRGNELDAPRVPEEQEPSDFPVLALIMPLLLGVAMAWVTGRPTYLLFTLLAPVMLVGNHFTQRRRTRRRHQRDLERFDAKIEILRARLDTDRVTERTVRCEETPPMRAVMHQAATRGQGLWSRRPEHWSFLNVRLGTGSMPSRTTVKVQSQQAEEDFAERVDSLVEKYRLISEVPVVENLVDAGALGIAGTRGEARGTLDALIVQITSLHSPAEVCLAAAVGPAWVQDLQWLSWLPHSSTPHSPVSAAHLTDGPASSGALLNALEAAIAERLPRGGSERRGSIDLDDSAFDRGSDVGDRRSQKTSPAALPAIVVVVTDDVTVDRPRWVRLAENGPDAGILVVWVADDVAALPAVCRTYVRCGAEPAVGFVRTGITVDDLVPEQINASEALAHARLMASVEDAGAVVEDATDLPRNVPLVSLLESGVSEDPSVIVEQWNARRPRAGSVRKLHAVVGSAGLEPMVLDVRTQGPHALVGGTSGAGKSEFLQAWVLSLAASVGPGDVTFLFVDYKGGSAFADCLDLPHCVGLVTDLTPSLVQRALTSLRAELTYRERVLHRAGAKDLAELEERGGDDIPPALLIVVDEFAALVSDVPDFVDGMVDIAQRGRSLGIHLILATQRPAGVIRDNLRANTALRIALRMADEHDSTDVVGVPDAAHLDPAMPGRGVVSTGPGRVESFQSAYAGGWTSASSDGERVEIGEMRFGSLTPWSAPRPAAPTRDAGPTDQRRLVDSIVGAARLSRIVMPRRPWLDELPTLVDVADLGQRPGVLVFGKADIPEDQSQEPTGFAPDTDGHLAVLGTGGSGKSTLLRTLTLSAGTSDDTVHVYGIDAAAGALRGLDELAHVGGIVSGDNTDRIAALLRLLTRERERRANAFAAVLAGTVAEYRTITGIDEARIVLLIDGFGAFREEVEKRPAWLDAVRDVLADGRALGLHIVLAADRPGALPTWVRSLIGCTVVLRTTDGAVPAKEAPDDDAPAGRAAVAGFAVQIATPGGTAVVAEQVDAMRLAACTGTAPPIRVLPDILSADTLPPREPGRGWIGVGADLDPYGFDAHGIILIAGTPGSGRSTATAWFVDAVDHTVVERYRCGPPKSLISGNHWDGQAVDPADVVALAAQVSERAMALDPADGVLCLVVEGIDDYLQTSADSVLAALFATLRRSGHLIIAEGETSAWGSAWPLMSQIRRARRGLVLHPEPGDCENILRTTVPRQSAASVPPGRGVWVERSVGVVVQVPRLEVRTASLVS